MKGFCRKKKIQFSDNFKFSSVFEGSKIRVSDLKFMIFMIFIFFALLPVVHKHMYEYVGRYKQKGNPSTSNHSEKSYIVTCFKEKNHYVY